MTMFMVAGLIPADLNLVTAEAASTTENTVTSWDAEAILAAADADNGLTLCGTGWSNNNCTDDKSFGDGTSALGANAKAGSTKAQTNGSSAAGTIPDNGCYLKYEAENNGTITFYVKTGSGKTFYIVGDDGSKVEKKNESSASSFDMVTADVTAGQTYYAYLGGATAQIWKVAFEKKVSSQSWAAEAILTATGGNGLTLCGTGWSNNDCTDDKSFGDGTSALGANAKAGSTKAQTNGSSAAGTIPDNGCYLKYEAENNGTITFYAKIGSGKTFYIVGDDGSKVEKKNESSASSFDMVTADVTAGQTYYAYLGGATAQIWKVTFTPPVDTVEWADVKAPVIESVTESDGNFIVKLSADTVIDKKKGAESVIVAMLENGNEVSSVVLTALGTGEVTFTPQWSGDYSFVATATRTGEAYKVSNVVEKNGYVLALNKPVLELVQNKGNGSVYLDWINVNGGDSFKVEYKKSSDSSYTVAEDGLTDGNYTVTGLTAGENYDFRISATRAEDGYVSTYEKSGFTVTADAEHQWYMAIVGSAQTLQGTLTDGTGAETAIDMSIQDSMSSDQKKNLMPMPDITNTTGKLLISGSENGKISDTEEGFRYYFTQIDPNTENFELTATFKITDTSLTLDNQTGFGIIAADMLGINYYGAPGYSNKHFNSVGNYTFSCKGAETFAYAGLRDVSGYTSVNTQDSEGRAVAQQNFSTKVASAVGTEATFTLRKTNDAFEAEYNGEKLTLDNTAALSVQEDGSLCVGVMTSRKISVEISDIKFSTSESTGVSGGNNNDESITPGATVYSSGTVGADTYKYIYQPNCAGTLKITNQNGVVVYDKAVEANEVVKVDVPVSIGENVITSVLNPTGSNLTSTAAVTKTTKVVRKKYGNEGETIVVSPTGTADGKGTMESPLDVDTALKYAQPGQTVLLMDGTYTKGATISRSVSGTAEKNITLLAENVGGVVFDGAGLTVIGDYWHIYGINVKNASNVGIQISGNYNTIEMCTVQASLNSGVQISRSGSADNAAGINYMLWPSYNLVKNCESFDNCDVGRNDADGFAAKLTCGNGNVFYGCISHNNIDDGWDLYAKAISGEIGVVTIENCVAYSNGWLTTDDTTAAGYNYGEGNGFKLGGGDMKGGHILINSISFNNGAKGITSNSCPDAKVYNSISYNNSVIPGSTAYNVGLNAKTSLAKEWVVEGLISMAASDLTDLADLIPFSLSSENNYIYDGSASYNSQGVKAVDDWFVSTDVTVAPTRNEDGTINMHDLLLLKDTAPADTGARLDVTSDKAISVKPEITKFVSGESAEEPTEEEPTEEEPTVEEPTVEEPTVEEPTEEEPTVEEPTEEEPTVEEPAAEKPTADASSDDDSDSDDEPETEASETTINIPVINPSDSVDVTGIQVAPAAIIRNSEGVEVPKDTIRLIVTKDGEYYEAQASRMNDALSVNDIKLPQDSVVDIVEAYFTSEDDAVLSANGSISITFSYPAGTSRDTHRYMVYHLLDNGVMETCTPVINEYGITVNVSSLSPFAIVAEAVNANAGGADDNAAQTDTSVATGDNAPILPVMFLMLSGIALLGCVYVTGKKRI